MTAPAPSRTLAAEGAPRGGLTALCITQTISWGVLYYALLAAVRPISDDTGWDPALITGPRNLMTGGSLAGVLALALVGLAPNLPVFTAAWLLAGTAYAMAAATGTALLITTANQLRGFHVR
ncbi:hypothetical protein M8J71_11205 [Pseudarthrobacter sp. R1]|uniref:hypothetical protein n=1 Tax=Pseudarthrobacter sp. R1 TaxID=2944934 RepID=UPI00210E4554|nr:hypothetical protein [Pseudarthrobacter sp. R1]MCQ6271049.1 hypothetical protein [Pseudarthrobacter sp. R1]